MENNYIFLDLDGVILNSEEKVKNLIEKFNPQTKKEWEQFFHNIDWGKLLKESKSINNSVEIIQELQLIRQNLMILTKVHTLSEMQAKTLDLRENRMIRLPILFVPPHIKKSQIYLPSNGEILVDDSYKNIDDWINNGGTGILFDESCDCQTQNKVKSLEFLLRR